jgi:hypothetical protein
MPLSQRSAGTFKPQTGPIRTVSSEADVGTGTCVARRCDAGAVKADVRMVVGSLNVSAYVDDFTFGK